MAKLTNLDPMVFTRGKMYQPVFAGKTEDNEQIVIYQHAVDHTYHIQRPNGELWAFSPNFGFKHWFDEERYIYHIEITSPEWTGKATGSRWDLMEVPAR